MKTIIHTAAACALLTLAACSMPTPPLSKVQVPAGFTFANSQAVDVSLSADARAQPAGGVSELTIARQDGKLVYRGSIDGAHPVQLQLSLPLKDAVVHASITGADGAPRSVQIPIVKSAARHAFE